MTSILADHQYTLEAFKQIYKQNTYKLDKQVFSIVNKLASLVGAPTYQKTPIFKHTQDRGGRNYNTKRRYHSHQQHRNIRRGRHNNNTHVITADDWAEMRNFKATKLEKNVDGIEKDIDDLRSLLNKLTAKNYNDIRDKIIVKLKSILDSNVDNENLEKVGKSIFEIGSANKFWSKLYAQLYKDLLNDFPIMEPVCKSNFDSFIHLFEDIQFVPAEEDYDKFCAINKINAKRRALSSFFIWLMTYDIIEPKSIIDIINALRAKFMENIDIEGKKDIVFEIGENLAILIATDTTKFKENCPNEYQDMIEFVEQITNLKHKAHHSLTSKTVFKFMDLIDEL